MQKSIGIGKNADGGIDVYIAETIGQEMKLHSELNKEEALQLLNLIKSKIVER